MATQVLATALRAPQGAAAISVRALSKNFRLPHERVTTVRERVLHPFSRSEHDVFPALHDVSLDIRSGEFMALVGRNGSGKSTLLRCIAGIYPPDAGEISVRGRIAPVIELAVGFNPDLAARDNAVMNAVLFGLTREEAEERFDDIIAFAELEPFVDQKLKNYSSGMAVRLAFSVTLHVDADIFLFDEVLAVGDAGFREKCYAQFDRLREERKTIVLVTHDMPLVERFADRAALISGGRLLEVGPPEEIAERYAEVNEEPRPAPPVPVPAQSRPRKRYRPLQIGSWRPFARAARWRFGTLLRTLSALDYKLKYADTALSYAWAVGRPLAMFGVLLLVFSNIGRFDAGVPHYAGYVLTAVMLWTFFAQTTAQSVQSLVRRSPILRKLPLPHLVVPLAVVTTAGFDLAINMGVVLLFLLATGVEPTIAWLELPLIVAEVGTLATGCSLLLSALYVRHRDLGEIWVVVSQMLFYCSAVFYTVSALPGPLDRVVPLANPIAAAVTETRHALIDPEAPSAAAAVGGAHFLLIPLAVTLGVLVLGAVAFKRESPRAAENA